MGVVYWVQAARWRRIADTRLGQRRFVEMVVAGVAVNNVLPGRVGDLLRARWVSRGAYSGGRGLATVMLDRALRHPGARRFPASEPAARDRRGLGRPDRRRVGRRARRDLGADPRGAVVHASPAEVAAHAPWAAAALPAGHARGALRPALGRARAPLVRDERARVGSLGGGRDPRWPRRRRRALARRRGLRHRGAQPRRRDSRLLQGSSARTSGSASQRLRCSGSVARRGSRSRSACRPSGTCRRRSSAR